MPNQSLSDFVSSHSPYPRFTVTTHCYDESVIWCKIAVPDPSWVTWQNGLFNILLNHLRLVFINWRVRIHLHFLRHLQFVNFACAVTGTCCKELVVLTELAFENIVFRMSFDDLHWYELVIELLPKEANTYVVSSDKTLACLCYRNGSERDFFWVDVQFFRFVFNEVPNADSSELVTEDNLTLVRVKHCAIDHNSAIIEVAHESCSLEIKYLKCRVFRSCEEPFIVLLKTKCRDVTLMSFKWHFRQRWHVWIHAELIDFHDLMRRNPDVLSIGGDSQFVNVWFWVCDLSRCHSSVHIPELDRVVVPCSRKNQLIRFLRHSLILILFTLTNYL